MKHDTGVDLAGPCAATLAAIMTMPSSTPIGASKFKRLLMTTAALALLLASQAHAVQPATFDDNMRPITSYNALTLLRDCDATTFLADTNRERDNLLFCMGYLKGVLHADGCFPVDVETPTVHLSHWLLAHPEFMARPAPDAIRAAFNCSHGKQNPETIPPNVKNEC